MTTENIAFDVSLVEIHGGLFRPGWPMLHLWFQCMHASGSELDHGTICVVAKNGRDGDWHESVRSVTRQQSQELFQLLTAAGLPRRAPELVGNADTSDGWARLGLVVSTPEQTRHVNIDMYSSGFSGPDAEALRKVFRQLFALAGHAQYSEAIYDPG